MPENLQQKRAIETTEGRVQILAGPGTGKTHTIVGRVLYLLQEKHVDPDHITVTTFTRKAAEELLHRISTALDEKGQAALAGALHIGNFHHLAAEILDEGSEFLPFRPGWEILDDVGETALLHRLLPALRAVPNAAKLLPDLARPDRDDPTQLDDRAAVRSVRRFLSQLREGFSDLSGNDAATRAAKELMRRYQQTLVKVNRMDYSEMLVRALELLQTVPALRARWQTRCTYLMVDEYQDTNPVQETIIRLLTEVSGNLCVVGDDDQSLYRFRGATVYNLLGFAERYEDVTQIRLETNYRSDGVIIDEALARRAADVAAIPGGEKWSFAKKLLPADPANVHPAAVAAIRARNGGEIARRTADAIAAVHGAGVPWRDIVVLSYTLSRPVLQELQRQLRERDIPVDAPRTQTLLTQPATRRFLTLLYGALRCVAQVPKPFPAWEKQWRALPLRGQEEREELTARLRAHLQNGGKVPLSDLLIRLLSLPSFQQDVEDAAGGADAAERRLRVVRNAQAQLLSLTREEQPAYLTLQGENADAVFTYLFGRALPLIAEVSPAALREEDETERDAVRLMTIHQAKGLEFAAVFFWDEPRRSGRSYRRKEGVDWLPRAAALGPAIAPEVEEALDHARLYYTARTRARNLLVSFGFGDPLPVTHSPAGSSLARKGASGAATSACAPAGTIGAFSPAALATLPFSPSTPKPPQRSFAYTTDIAAYRACPFRYYLFRIIGLPQNETHAAAYGTLVHRTLSLLHRRMTAAFPGQAAQREVLQRVYGGMRRAAAPLSEQDGLRAAEEIARYAQSATFWKTGAESSPETGGQVPSNGVQPPESRAGVESERNIRAPFHGQMLEGSIDLLVDGGRQIVDFKTARPDAAGEETYQNQLRFYRFLLALAGGPEAGEGVLWYTSETDPARQMTRLDTENDAAFLEEVARTMDQILDVNFASRTKDTSHCAFCVMREHCGRGRLWGKEAKDAENAI